VKKGGTGATTAGGALQNLLPEFTSNNGKVLGLTGGAPTWVEQAQPTNAYMFPDYAKMDATSRITEHNETWVVEEDGYVYVNVSSTGIDNHVIYINDEVVGNSAASYGASNGVFPVRAGDKVRLWNTNTQPDPPTFVCKFIPPIYSTPPQPIVVEGGDYLESEVPVMVYDHNTGAYRQKLWVDGTSPIYQKTIVWTSTNPGLEVGYADKIGSISGIKNILEQSVVANTYYNQGAIMLQIIGSDIYLRNDTTTPFGANEAWYITIQYTKN
jgi:hypothetical protein